MEPQISDHLSANPALESIRTVVKSNLLKFGLQKKLLSNILEEAAREKDFGELRQYQQNTNYYLEKCFGSLEAIQQYLGNGCNLIRQG
jgi:hypothetical protein